MKKDLKQTQSILYVTAPMMLNLQFIFISTDSYIVLNAAHVWTV